MSIMESESESGLPTNRVPKGSSVMIPNNTDPLTVVVEWMSRKGVVCDLDAVVLTYDARSQNVEKVDFGSSSTLCGSVRLEADLEMDSAAYTDQEILTVSLGTLDPDISAVLVYLDGSNRNFQHARKLSTRCYRHADQQSTAFDLTDDEDEELKKPLFDIEERSSIIRDVQAMCMCVMYRNVRKKNKKHKNRKGTASGDSEDDEDDMDLEAEQMTEWSVHSTLMPIYETSSAAKVNECGAIVVNVVPAFERFKPHLFPTVISICNALSSHTLPKLKHKFIDGDGLPMNEFMEVIFRQLYMKHRDALQNPVECSFTVAMLQEMFYQIDFNSDGNVDWEEFTSFCIQTGMLTTNKHTAESSLDQTTIEYQEEGVDLEKGVLEGHKAFEQLRHVPELNRIVLVPADGAHVTMLDSQCTHLVDFVPENITASESVRVYDMIYIPSREEFAFSASDHAICIVREQTNLRGRKYYTRTRDRLFSKDAMLKLAWAEPSKLLFSVGSNKALFAWSIDQCSCVFSCKRHTDLVTDLQCIAEYGLMVSASIDRRIMFWDCHKFHLTSILSEHKRGVRTISYGQGVLLSAGFDADALTWDVSTREPLLVLRGHRHPISKACILAEKVDSSESLRAITVDDVGEFRVWDIYVRERKSGRNFAPLLQTFRLWDVPPPINKISHMVLPYEKELTIDQMSNVIAGSSRLFHFVPRRKLKEFVPPQCVYYNSAAATFITCVNKDVYVYDAVNGQFQRSIANATDSEITCVGFDLPRQRRLLLGTHNGCIVIVNYVTGQVIDNTDPHSRDVTSAFMYPEKRNYVVSTGLDGRLCKMEETQGELVVMRALDDIFGRKLGVAKCALSKKHGALVCASTSTIWGVWDFHSMRRLMSEDDEEGGGIADIAVSDKYDWIMTACVAGFVRIWSLNTYEEKVTQLFVLRSDSVLRDASLTCLVSLEKPYDPESQLPQTRVGRRSAGGAEGDNVGDDASADDGSIASLKHELRDAGAGGDEDLDPLLHQQPWVESIIGFTDTGHVVVWELRSFYEGGPSSIITSRRMFLALPTPLRTKIRRAADAVPSRHSARSHRTADSALPSVLEDEPLGDRDFRTLDIDGDDQSDRGSDADIAVPANDGGAMASVAGKNHNAGAAEQKTDTVGVAEDHDAKAPGERGADEEDARIGKEGSGPVPSSDDSEENLDGSSAQQQQAQDTVRVVETSMDQALGGIQMASTFLTGQDGEDLAPIEVYEPTRHWKAHSESILLSMGFQTHGTVLTVSSDGYHRMWLLSGDAMGEFPLPNRTAEMKLDPNKPPDISVWKFVLQRLPVSDFAIRRARDLLHMMHEEERLAAEDSSESDLTDDEDDRPSRQGAVRFRDSATPKSARSRSHTPSPRRTPPPPMSEKEMEEAKAERQRRRLERRKRKLDERRKRISTAESEEDLSSLQAEQKEELPEWIADVDPTSARDMMLMQVHQPPGTDTASVLTAAGVPLPPGMEDRSLLTQNTRTRDSLDDYMSVSERRDSISQGGGAGHHQHQHQLGSSTTISSRPPATGGSTVSISASSADQLGGLTQSVSELGMAGPSSSQVLRTELSFEEKVAKHLPNPAFSEHSLLKGSMEGYYGGEEHRRLRVLSKDSTRTETYSRQFPQVTPHHLDDFHKYSVLRNSYGGTRSRRSNSTSDIRSLRDEHAAELKFGPQAHLYQNARQETINATHISEGTLTHLVTMRRMTETVNRVRNLGTLNIPDTTIADIDDGDIPYEADDTPLIAPSMDLSSMMGSLVKSREARRQRPRTPDETLRERMNEVVHRVQSAMLVEDLIQNRELTSKNSGHHVVLKESLEQKLKGVLRRVSTMEAAAAVFGGSNPSALAAKLNHARKVKRGKQAAQQREDNDRRKRGAATHQENMDAIAQGNTPSNSFVPYSVLDVRNFMRHFNEVDNDLSGALDFNEWKRFVAKMNPDMPEAEVHGMFLHLDADQSYTIDLNELIPVVFPKCTRQQHMLIEMHIQIENNKAKQLREARITKQELGQLFELYVEGDTDHVPLGRVRDLLMGMELPENTSYKMLAEVEGMGDEVMLSKLEFIKLFSKMAPLSSDDSDAKRRASLFSQPGEDVAMAAEAAASALGHRGSATLPPQRGRRRSGAPRRQSRRRSDSSGTSVETNPSVAGSSNTAQPRSLAPPGIAEAAKKAAKAMR